MTTLRFLIILLLVLNALAVAGISGWLGNAPGGGEAARITAQLDPERIRLTRELAPGTGLAAAPGGAPAALRMPTPPPPAPAVQETPAVATADTTSTPVDPLEQAPGEDVGSTGLIADDADEGAGTDSASTASAPLAQAPSEDEAGPAGGIEGAQPGTGAPAAPEAAAQADAAAPPAEPAAAGPPPVCQAWANLTVDQADRLSQRLRRIGVTPARVRTETPDSWWVRIPPQRTRAEAERRVVELNLLGVTDTFIVQEAGPTQYAVSLGLFKTEARARVLLGQLRAKGVDGAGIEPRMSTSYRIQATLPANELRPVETAAPGLRGKRQPCATR
ncbi:MAG: SPOR domain-containing protein [Thauera sp.]